MEHATLSAGDPCPDCLGNGEPGKLYEIKPGILLRLVGQPLISGTRYSIEKLRCLLCGKLYVADVPDEVANTPKYAPSCLSNIAIGRYWLGLPFKRIELWQGIQGVPVADATQWDKMASLSVVVQPVYDLLQKLAAEGDSIFYDDTPNKILSLKQAANDTRQGVYTTAIVSQVANYSVYLFMTSQQYAGENVAPLLNQRDSKAPAATMSDASPMNIPKGVHPELLERWIMCFCLVHGRRKFFEVMKFFDAECDFVLKQIGLVYYHEKLCKERGYNDTERLLFHQRHSAPVMEALHMWLMNHCISQTTEANSGLGQAIHYMLRHWQALTRFLRVPGAPIDNSLCERAIKVAIRHRRNSLFYKTTHGAAVGDCLMSIIHTAARNGVNPYDYLTALQIYATDVAHEPELWLPWHYQHSMTLAKAA